MLSTLVNVDSKRTLTLSVTLKPLARPRLAAAAVPGPSRMPTSGACRCRCECCEIEVVSARLALIEIRRDLVGAQVSPAIDDIGVGLIVGIADAGREPRAGLKQSHGGHLPTAEQRVLPPSTLEKRPALTERQLVETG